MVAKWNSKTYSYFDMFVDIWLQSLQKVHIMRQIFFLTNSIWVSKNAKCDADFDFVEENEEKNHPKKLWIENFCAQ
jgi:hypothetical protein